jgi:hydrogenase maturation protein HypF
MIEAMIRHYYVITGIVQGVGFRPFVFRMATQLGLTGWVRNSPAGVEFELQGATDTLRSFSLRLQVELPPLALITSLDSHEIPVVDNEAAFVILASSDGRREAQIAPDSAICPDCLQELFDPSDRRYYHPFITCTNCGPRWTIVTGIPYDRPLTTMSGFSLCPACEVEYRNPLNRRFHAQPIACPDCGPQLLLSPPSHQRGRSGERDAVLMHAVALLQWGQIVAIKGLGGYHLAVDACNDEAVARLRQRKQRDEKPFAVMVSDLAVARQFAELSEIEERLLAGAEAPVVIVRSRPDSPVSPLVAPGSQWIGLMLAYTPLHQLLFHCQGSGVKGQENALDSPLAPCPLPLALVMTSANAADEPMISGDDEASEKLSGIADAILTHNRPIHVRTDDSVLRVFQGKPLFYRRSRGYVPRPVVVPLETGKILAVGAELKNTVCLTRGTQAFLSQHIGDLKNEATLHTFRQTISHLSSIMEIRPDLVVCDQHPDYLSTRYAEESGLPLLRVQHHHAHLASCMAENGLDGEVIGVIFDGTGLGDDGTIWGGEFLVGGYDKVQRAGHLKPVRLPGGDAAAREPWRMTLAWLYQCLGDAVWNLPGMPLLADSEKQILQTMLKRGLNSPFTSSAGRLFDAVAFLVGAATCNRFDGQAGMALEGLAETGAGTALLPYRIEPGLLFQLDPVPLLLELIERLRSGEAAAGLAWAFHASLSAAVTDGCEMIQRTTGLERVVLSGGVFQNRLLSGLVYTSLIRQGFKVFTHRLVPPNDGGIALGQAVIAAKRS